MAWNVRHQRPVVSARTRPAQLSEFLQRYVATAEAAVAEPFHGITTGGESMGGLFPIARTGVPTTPIKRAVEAFIGALDAGQRAQASFPVLTDAWRRWSNIHPCLMRHGVSLEALTAMQRERALDILRASLSDRGFATARSVMKLNDFIGEVTGRWDEYGEWLYWLSVMGTPSDTEPWGWQLDGHHLVVNCLILGDQLVMTPTFMGSEPVAADTGTHAGTRVFAEEEGRGLALMRALDVEARQKATIGHELPVELFTAAFRDNAAMKDEGIRYDELPRPHQEGLLDLIDVYVGRIRPGHATVRLDEVRRHLAETWFAWMGGTEPTSVFYYRIHNPVILIEFDHQRGIALDNDEPARTHIHTVVRTPNGNDYGMDLLRQHHARFDHSRGRHDARG